MTANPPPPQPSPHDADDSRPNAAPATPGGRFNPWLDSLPPFVPRAVTLTGRHVILTPLRRDHAADLFAFGREPDLWHYLPRPPLVSVDDAVGFIEQALRDAALGTQIPFALVDSASGRAVGSSRYLDIRPHDRALEIGWTWIGKPFQRTAVNTEAKLLLLTHAFEAIGAIRVQLKTDLRNTRSQAAIERLGAQKEGVLHHHMITWNGYLRDTVMYSITRAIWPTIQSHLQTRLAAHSA